MTREESKRLLPVLQAFAEGKEIELETDGGWSPIKNGADLTLAPAKCYRVKPQPTYRPFKDAEECWNEMQKHQPFGWCKTEEGNYYPITSIAANDDFNSSFNNFTFADGSVFGVKEGGDI